MARKKKELPLLEQITITDVAAEGKALARVNDMVVFVPYVVPGDVVDLQVKRKKHSYAEAVAVKFHEYSPLRSEPFCKHFGVCGGCKWQCLNYEDQIRFKQKQVTDNLVRIGKIELPEISPILGSELTERYRNKLEFTFSNKRWLTQEEINSQLTIDNGQLTMNSEDSKELGQQDGNNCQLSTVNCQFNRNAVGFHIPGAFDKVLAIDECHLMDDICNRIRNGVRDYAYEHGYTFFDLRSQEGMLRNMMIRIAEDENERSIKGLMVVMQFKIVAPEEEAKMLQLLQYMADTWPEITSLIYVINNKCNDTIGDLPIRVFKGEDHIIEEMEGLKFKVGPKSFYQTNTRQAYNLYKVAREFAGLTGDELVYDLYTGTGTIAQFVSRQASKVIGIEYVPEAIEDAKINAANNNITNCDFYAGDMKDILTDAFVEEHGHPDVIILDPPRAGIHPDVAQVILNAAPDRMVYVSCNPASQARDLEILCKDYVITAVRPVDMFPHTHHVENVVALKRR